MFLGGSSSVFTWCIDLQKPISLADKAYLFCSAWSWQDEVHWRDGFRPIHPSSGKTTSRGKRLGCFLSAGATKHLLTVGPSVDSKRPPFHWDYSLSHLSHTGFCSVLTGSKWLMRQEDLIPFQKEDESNMGSKSSTGNFCSGWQCWWNLIDGGKGMCPEKMTDSKREALRIREPLLLALTSVQQLWKSENPWKNWF